MNIFLCIHSVKGAVVEITVHATQKGSFQHADTLMKALFAADPAKYAARQAAWAAAKAAGDAAKEETLWKEEVADNAWQFCEREVKGI